MEPLDNTGLGLIKATIERVQSNQLFASALKKLINSSEAEVKEFLSQQRASQIFAKLISANHRIELGPLNGQTNIAGSGDVFAGYLDHEFKLLHDRSSQPTGLAPIDVFESSSSWAFKQLFSFISLNISSLAMTQHQIVSFCQTYPQWLNQEGGPTLFLFEDQGNLLVAVVKTIAGGLSIVPRKIDFVYPRPLDKKLIICPQFNLHL